MYILFYLTLIIFSVCDFTKVFAFTTFSSNMSTVRLKTLPTDLKETTNQHPSTSLIHGEPTVERPFTNLTKLINIEEKTIKEIKLEIVNASLKLKNINKKCQDEIEMREIKFKKIRSTYGLELEKQRQSILNYDKIKLKIKEVNSTLHLLKLDIEKQKLTNLLLVQNVNQLAKDRVLGFYKKCQVYQKPSLLETRSLNNDLQSLFNKPRFSVDKLLHRLFRLQNMTKILKSQRNFVLEEIHFLYKRCEEEMAIIMGPVKYLNETISQLKINTLEIEQKSHDLKNLLEAFGQKVAIKKQYLTKLKIYNKILQQRYKIFYKDRNCYFNLVNEVITL